MRWRRLGPLVVLPLLSGCHRLTGYREDTYGEGTLRHYAGLSIGYHATIALCAIGAIVGSGIVILGVVRPERHDRRQTAWGAVLVVVAVVVAVRVHSGFGDIRYCC